MSEPTGEAPHPPGEPGTPASAGAPGDPGRRRPAGGAAARRLTHERPVHPPRDHRRESERYRRASLGEQMRSAVAAFIGNPAAVVIVGLLVGGWLILRFLTPPTVELRELATGDCLYIRWTSPDGAAQVGPDSETRARLLDFGAERASCGLSHSHEVAAVVPVEGDVFPGAAGLEATAGDACDAALAALTNARPDVALAVIPVVPDELRWARGVHSAVCLVRRADRSFLDTDVVPEQP